MSQQLQQAIEDAKDKLKALEKAPKIRYIKNKTTGQKEPYYNIDFTFNGNRYQKICKQFPEYLEHIKHIKQQLTSPAISEGKQRITIEEAFYMYYENVRRVKIKDCREDRANRNKKTEMSSTIQLQLFYLLMLNFGMR
jgi:hypothetical protein